MAESSGKRILKMAASATGNEELWRKLQLKYEIPIYAIKLYFRKYHYNTAFKFFSQKTPYQLNESREISLGAHFPPYQWFYWTDCFQKKVGFSHVWTRTNFANFIKIGSKL